MTSGTTAMLFERIRTSAAGTALFGTRRGLAVDGIQFIEDEFSVTSGVSFAAPALVRTAQNSIRMYYSGASAIHSALSLDETTSWIDEGAVAILGRSDTFAPFPGEVSIIREASGKYLMFFTSPRSTSSDGNEVFTAESIDGREFYVHDRVALERSAQTSLLNPEAVVLSDSSIRLYVVEQSGTGSGVVRRVRSAIGD